jgi:hypothetical protein
LSHFGQEFVGQRRQYAGAVARRRLAAASTPVAHPPQHVVGIQHQLMTSLAFDVRHNPHTASIFLVGGIVEAVLFGISVHVSQTHFRLGVNVVRSVSAVSAGSRRIASPKGKRGKHLDRLADASGYELSNPTRILNPLRVALIPHPRPAAGQIRKLNTTSWLH